MDERARDVDAAREEFGGMNTGADFFRRQYNVLDRVDLPQLPVSKVDAAHLG